MTEKIPSSLDARELLVRSSKDTFYTKKHEIGGEAVMLWGILDAYLQNLEPISGYRDDEIIPLERHSPLYRETRKQLFRIIYRMPGFDIKNIDTIQIDKSGMLSVNYKTGGNITINLIEEWNNILKPKPSTTPIKNEMQKLTQSLERDIHTESYFDGSVLVSYIPATATIAAGAHSVYHLLGNTKNAVEMIIEKIMIKNAATGKMETIPLGDIYRGTKASIAQNLIKILERAGYVYLSKEKGFYSPIERALGETKKTIQNLTYEEYTKNRPQNPLSKEQFEGMKRNIMGTIEGTYAGKTAWSSRINALINIIGRNAGELIFMPIFFRHFNQYQNTATVIQGITEMGLFTAGAKLGSKIPIPGVGKFLTPLVGGGAFILAGAWGADKLDANRKKWQYLHGNGFGSIFTKGKSTTGHFVGNLGVFNMNEYMDFLNKGGQKLAEITGVKSDDIDIGIPRVEMSLPGGKYMGTLPEINLFQSTVNFGTNPWDWMRGAVGRDIVDWNKKVDLYRDVLKKKIGEILGKYLKNESMFASDTEIKKYGNKENLLKVHLLDILGGGNEGTAFEGEKGALIESLVAYVSGRNSQDIKQKYVYELIDNRTSQMYIDAFFVEKHGEILQMQKGPSGFNSFIPQITKNPDTQKYIAGLLDRMIAEKSLFAPGKWKKTNVLGMSSNKWIPSEEGTLFQNLLMNTDEISVQFPRFSGKTTVGNAFAMFLDMILDHKRELEFLSEIQKGNKKGVEWTL